MNVVILSMGLAERIALKTKQNAVSAILKRVTILSIARVGRMTSIMTEYREGRNLVLCFLDSLVYLKIKDIKSS